MGLTLPRRPRLRAPDNVASEEAQLTWLDVLTEQALARELPTRAEALKRLQRTDARLSAGQAERLHEAGTTAYNHNLNTAEANYGDICTTHSYQDRADTVRKAQQAGLSPCSGLIAGMGETDTELADVVFALRELDPDSVPVNFLIPFEGTPLGGQWA